MTSNNRSSATGQPARTCQFKMVLLGESAVGKSSLVLRFVKGQFHEYQESTIGAAFLTQTVSVDDTTVKLELWDTAGQERYHSLAPMYYRGAQAAIVVYDITNADTFSRAKVWVKELQRQAAPNIVIALAGNKVDLATKRQVEVADAQTYAEENGLIFMETSAKTSMNVNDIFMAIARKLPKTQDTPNPSGGRGRDNDGQRVRVNQSPNQRVTENEGGCCGSKRGSFTLSGALTGFILSIIIAYSNIVFLLVIMTFVLSGSFVTRYKFDIKQSKINENDHQIQTKKYKKTARDHIQVLCNGSIACLYAIGYCWKTNYSGLSLPIDNKHESSIYSIGFIFTIACCCGDTLASELGSVLAQKNPRLLTNPFRIVPVGTNGAISLVGCLFSLFGGFIIGLSYIIGNVIFCRPDYMINTWTINIQLLFYCTLFGLLGSSIDSLLGATLQFSGYDRERNVTVQLPGPSIERISGRNILSNNQVNLLSSFLTSIIAIWILPSIMV
ncbi:unnamed protein product [Rotaria sordida]|uniref:Transmembrane protein 19 n=1 Tax=Rotaria sordida TaxID=392033 RepID=A0A814ANG9_9BILA|nr:unnamed protein product [Rotaria sordida]CAF3674132.1 unnamed protein product [Rotaria sordida]